MTNSIRVLLVMPEEDLRVLLATPEARTLDVVTARDCGEARLILAGKNPIDVVVSDLTLDDGNWWCVYQDLTNRDVCAEMVVVAPRLGLNVSEILAHGVFSVLAKPLDGLETVRTIEEAAARKVNGKGPRAPDPAIAGV